MIQLAKRQRAMLGEMGIRIWQPEPVAPAPDISVSPSITQNKIAIDSVASSDFSIGATVPFDTKKRTFETPVKPQLPDRAIASPVTIQTTQTKQASQAAPSGDTWRVGGLQTLYSNPAAATTKRWPKRWLLLLEQPESALQSDFNALAGDTGKLLDNMLRAAKLHLGAVVMLAPLVRTNPAAGDSLTIHLTDVLASATPDMILSMGRLAGQAVLQSPEPFARLRGQVHSIQNTKTVITLDPTYLLRYPLEKAKAWDDMCLALSVVGD